MVGNRNNSPMRNANGLRIPAGHKHVTMTRGAIKSFSQRLLLIMRVQRATTGGAERLLQRHMTRQMVCPLACHGRSSSPILVKEAMLIKDKEA